MSTFNDPSAARESARQDNGQFGTQPRAEAGGVDLLPASAGDFDPAVVAAAIERAKSTGRPAYIEHPTPGQIDLDETGTNCMAGDYSVGAEPSVRYTWATGDDAEPFVSVTTTSWVSARLDGADNDLSYDDWQEVTARLERADEADAQADGIYNGISTLTDNERERANLDIDRLRRLAAGIREEEGVLRYAREEMTEWITHTDVNDPGSSEVRSEYEHGDGSSTTFDTLADADAASRRHVEWLQPGMYAPENYKK